MHLSNSFLRSRDCTSISAIVLEDVSSEMVPEPQSVYRYGGGDTLTILVTTAGAGLLGRREHPAVSHSGNIISNLNLEYCIIWATFDRT